MTDRRKLAAYLFSEMNGIDDDLLQEAIRPRVSARSMRMTSIRRVAILAAALTLALAMLIGTALVALRSGKRTEDAATQSYVADMGGAEGDAEKVASLSWALVQAESAGSVSRLSAEQVELFDGKLLE